MFVRLPKQKHFQRQQYRPKIQSVMQLRSSVFFLFFFLSLSPALSCQIIMIEQSTGHVHVKRKSVVQRARFIFLFENDVQVAAVEGLMMANLFVSIYL